MLISCEKCSTTYVLDDKLIPAQGAPVQCTRCGHVFTAKVTTAPPAPAPAFHAPVPGADASTNKTILVTGDPTSPANSGAKPASSTMMFGAVGGGAPAMAPAAAPGAAKQTAMFGAVGGGAPAMAPAAAPSAASSTMMFGAVGGGAPAMAPAAAPSAAKQTAMFGAPGAQAPAMNSAANRTMMFGASDAAAPVAPPNREALNAPELHAPAASSTPNRTMMFGAAGAQTPAAPPSRAALNAPELHAPAASSAPNRTMMFGAAGTEATVPPPQRTTLKAEEAHPPATNASPSSTMMFGAVGAQAASAQNVGRQTMMFGAPGAEAASAVPPPSQAVLSTPESEQTLPPGAANRTMMFGVSGNNEPQSAPAAAPVPAPNRTMMFGAPGAQAPADGNLNNRTMMFGGPQASAPAAAPETSPRAGGSGTQMFGAPAPVAPAPAAVPSGTMMFGVVKPPDAAPAEPDVTRKPATTMVFGLSGKTQPPAPAPVPDRGALAGGTVRVPAAQLEQMMHAGAESDHTLQGRTILDRNTHHGREPAGPLPGSASSHRADRVDLPPETPAFLTGGNSDSDLPSGSFESDPVAQLRAHARRRNAIAGGVIGTVLAIALGSLLWSVISKKLMVKEAPPEAVAVLEKAMAQLRFDDTSSKAGAADELKGLVAQYPDFIEAHAGLVTAVALQLDDVQQRVRRLEAMIERKNTLVARYGKERSPDNWETLAQQLQSQVEQHIKEHKPLADQAQGLDGKAREAYRGLENAANRVGTPSTPARLAALRAQGIYHGVSGTDQALKLSKRYQDSLEGATADGWIDLVIPEYAVNARVSEELVTQAMTQLDALKKHDSTFLRGYVLSARLHLLKKDFEAAATDLDTVITMRKEHDVANELREWIKKQPKADEKPAQ